MGAMAGAGGAILDLEVTQGRNATDGRGTKMKNCGFLRAWWSTVITGGLWPVYPQPVTRDKNTFILCLSFSYLGPGSLTAECNAPATLI